MSVIAPHIDYLIRHHDCVVIPGIGALIGTPLPAAVDEETMQFLPPRRFVGFNSQITHNDGLLANSVARRERTDYDRALAIVEEEAADMAELLRREGEVALGTTGILRRGSEGELNFTPALSPGERALRSGFAAVSLPGSRKKEDEPTPALRHFDSARNYYIAINKRFARAAAMFMLVLSVCLTVLLPGAEEPALTDHASVVPVAVTKAVHKKVTSAVAPDATPSLAESTPKQCQLIVAAFATLGEAQKYIAANAAKADSLRIVESRRYVFVSAAEADSSAELRQIMRRPGFLKEYPQAWIRNQR